MMSLEPKLQVYQPIGANEGHGTVTDDDGVRRSTRVTFQPAYLGDEMGGIMTEEERDDHEKELAIDEYAREDCVPFHNTHYNMIHDYSLVSTAYNYVPYDPTKVYYKPFDSSLVGAASSGGFENTAELIPMKYDEAMQTKDKKGWEQSVKDEWERFKKYDVFRAVKRTDVPDNAKFVSTTWAMKKKSNGTLRARLNMRGFEQQDGVHFDSQSIASPVTTDVTVRIILTLMLMANWVARLLDIRGAFLHGEFDNNKQIYSEVPQGFERFVDPLIYVLLLGKTCYGLKQAARMFWKELLKAMRFMKFARSNCDPCLYWKDTDKGMVFWLSWVDDCLCVGPDGDVIISKNEMKKLFDCDDVGAFEEYVGCKIDHNVKERSLKFTQPVLTQSFEDEFDLPDYKYMTPAESGQVLGPVQEGQEVGNEKQSLFRRGVGKLLHMMRWSRPEIWNATREVSRRMQIANPAHFKAMLRDMKYCVNTPNRGWTLKPNRTWDGKDKSFEFIITAKSDSNYATCKETRRSVTGFAVYLEGALISVKSGMQKIVALSVSEAEIIALVQCIQEVMFVKKIIESIGLKVKLPIHVEVDNQATVDLVNGWSIAGGTKHSEVRIMWLRELKEKGILRVFWHPNDENESDVFTKNLARGPFDKCVEKLIGRDEYFEQKEE